MRRNKATIENTLTGISRRFVDVQLSSTRTREIQSWRNLEILFGVLSIPGTYGGNCFFGIHGTVTRRFRVLDAADGDVGLRIWMMMWQISTSMEISRDSSRHQIHGRTGELNRMC
jgi:hypothetical protein